MFESAVKDNKVGFEYKWKIISTSINLKHFDAIQEFGCLFLRNKSFILIYHYKAEPQQETDRFKIPLQLHPERTGQSIVC